MLVLSERDVEEMLSQSVARQIVRDAAAAYVAGRAIVPRRIHMHVDAEQGEMLVMPGLLPDLPMLGLKTVGEFPRNLAKGLHSAPACLLLLDPVTGYPTAVVGATWLTLVRTAAMSVVAAEHLAVAAPRTLALVGAGGQALAHVDAFADRYPLEIVRVTSRTLSRAEALIGEARGRHPGIRFAIADSVEDACEGADIVIAATTAKSPVIPGGAVGPGQLVIGIGSHSPDAAEIDGDVVRRADVIAVDTKPGSLAGAGDILPLIEAGEVAEESVVELGELVTGRHPGRVGDDQLCLFKSVGFAALDLTAAALLMDRARERGLGATVSV